MAIGDDIYEALNAKLGFAPDPVDDTSATYKTLVPGKVWLYFGRGDENEGPWLGFWVEETISEWFRKGLGVILHNELSLDADKVIHDGVYIYRTLKLRSVSASVIINSVIETMNELERHTKKLINEMV
jgi:hypothetical protein